MKKKIIINGEEVDIYTSIDEEEIENNNDLLKKELLEDTINLSNVIKEIKNGDKNG